MGGYGEGLGYATFVKVKGKMQIADLSLGVPAQYKRGQSRPILRCWCDRYVSTVLFNEVIKQVNQ